MGGSTMPAKPIVKVTIQLPVMSSVKAAEETAKLVADLREKGHTVKGFSVTT